MNERIRELAEHADIKESLVVQFKGDRRAYVVQYNELEKFAELIVRECIQFRTVLTQFDGTTPYGDGYENGLRDMAEVIAEHFGVE